MVGFIQGKSVEKKIKKQKTIFYFQHETLTTEITEKKRMADEILKNNPMENRWNQYEAQFSRDIDDLDNNDDDDFSESDSDRKLFIALTQFLFEYGHSRGYY
jgi:uncharacterized sporulation protein YeaH/YhbH (DUF444 family)